MAKAKKPEQAVVSADISASLGYQTVLNWFAAKGWQPFPFQEEAWQAFLSGRQGLLNAPTGSGKTFALWMPVLIDWINRNPENYAFQTQNKLQVLWITPLRALAKDIHKAMMQSAWELDIPWLIKLRTGDISAKDKQQIKKLQPEVLVTTPESLHIMLAQKDYPAIFKNLQAVIVDEWHELVGSKRGVMVELGLSRLRGLQPGLRTWCISATIGNLAQSLEVLAGPFHPQTHAIIKANIEKKLEIESILPDEIERFPWAGHLGLKLAEKLLPIFNKSRSTLVFINTRGQTEIWYKHLLELEPDLAGQMALHHGSLDRDLRTWVEEAIHDGRLKVVICTSSLDLGVDFDPVETVVQIGSPKGVARFLQRAGRSGHRPGAVSRIYFLPTHALELMEAAALKAAIRENAVEDRKPMHNPFDVLLQYLVTLAVSDGFYPDQIFKEVRSAYSFRDMTEEEWAWILQFITSGGDSLREYNEYQKVEIMADGLFKVTRRRTAMQHRMSIGAIISDPMMHVKYMKGGSLGSIEESFISRLKPGDSFWFAGRPLELIQVKEMTALVKKSNNNKAIIPSWLGGRMSLSSQLSDMMRVKIDDFLHGKVEDPEVENIRPLLELQAKWSALPPKGSLLIEKLQSKEGWHLFFYPFVGRAVHEGLSALTAFRLAQRQPITFSIAMNDYGFELLSDEEVDIEDVVKHGLFSTQFLQEDMMQSLNGTEMAKRRFREIAQISGLLFTGYPGKMKKNRHLQASSGLLFDVFREYDPDNLLIRQAYDEVFHYQLDEVALRQQLEKLSSHPFIFEYPKKPTPFAFPIMVDRMRETITSEKLSDRILKLQLQLESDAG